MKSVPWGVIHSKRTKRTLKALNKLLTFYSKNYTLCHRQGFLPHTFALLSTIALTLSRIEKTVHLQFVSYRDLNDLQRNQSTYLYFVIEYGYRDIKEL